ncbi:MAG: triacylglycerol lipase [Oscillospiraceae bacterium]|nr:triacylglycerol lipase [Oscillospiraceae bacterium]
MKGKFFLTAGIYGVLYALVSGCYSAVAHNPLWLVVMIPLFLLIHAVPGFFSLKTKSKRLKGCYHGTVLLTAFSISVLLSLLQHGAMAFRLLPEDWQSLVWSVVVSVCTHTLLFWNGIIWVYLTSVQLGIKRRIIGIACGMIPVANLMALGFILATTYREVETEIAHQRRNEARKADRVCATRYPVLLVHGVFFRDSRYFNYWGRIPSELEENGAAIFYGNHQSASSVDAAAEELAVRIREVLAETGAEKVNLIAHSKGGLDCRRALANPEICAMVASLTTINTPHRGCLFADYLLTKIPQSTIEKTARLYNSALKRLGDPDPDFLAAISDLTESACRERNRQLPDPMGVYCQSVGSTVRRATGGKFPLNFSYHLVKYFGGANDGLVGDTSFPWGENHILLTPSGRRGISHGDMIDLNRENIPGFDVREFYVNLLKDLKDKGM